MADLSDRQRLRLRRYQTMGPRQKLAECSLICREADRVMQNGDYLEYQALKSEVSALERWALSELQEG